MSEIQKSITEVGNLPPVANILARFQSDAGITELGALVLLQDCFQEEGTDTIACVLSNDVRFLSKWHNISGKDAVLLKLSDLQSGNFLAKAEINKNISFPSLEDQDRLGDVFKPLMTFVDGEYRGFSLVVIGPEVPGANCSYSVSLESDLQDRPNVKTGLIKQIFFNHFKRSVSGLAMFASLRCIPSPEALRQVTQLQVKLIQGSGDEVTLSLYTCTEKFECFLQAGDLGRLVRWAHAVASGVDRCTALLWQRCQIELTARSLAPGWIRLMVRSARKYERYDLVAVVSVHDLITQLSTAFDGLAQASSQSMEREERSSHSKTYGASLGILNWPVVPTEAHWRDHESEMEG